MDISKLALFCDVADTNNLTLSAERMGYTQSGVSHAISKLETEMGVRIIRRTKHGVELTAEGNLLLPYIRLVVSHYERMDGVLDSIIALRRGSLCIGSYCSIASEWLPHVVKQYKQLYPNIDIKIREGGTRDIERWLCEGSIDFGFLSWKKEQNFKFISLARDPLYAIAPKSYSIPDSYDNGFPVSAFSDYPFIASESGVDNDVTLTLEQASVSPMTSFTCKDDHTVVSMVAQGLGISLIPNMFLKSHSGEVRKFTIKPCAVRTLGIGLLSERSVSKCANAFIKLSVKMIPTICEHGCD